MAGDDAKLAGLTRALLLGTSLGAAPLLLVGCVPPGQAPRAAEAVARPALPLATEMELCERVLASRDHRDAELLLQTYPQGRCVPATLAALPPQTLGQISPAVLDNVPVFVRRQIPPQAAIHLRFPTPHGVAQVRDIGSY